jgi:polysaccharide deacetylase 2 family uncharacterized protein YibQ
MVRRPSGASRGRRFPGLLLFLLGFVAGGASFYFGCRDVSRGAEKAPAQAASSTPASRHSAKTSRKHGASLAQAEAAGAPTEREAGEKAATAEKPPALPAPRAEAGGKVEPDGGGTVAGVRIAIVIDDLGRSVEDVQTLARLGVPLTYAVLPFESETPEVVAALHRERAELLLHLPMQPQSHENPGPGALLYGMDREALQKATANALAAVPGAVGVNNHMGSRLSADEPSMRAVLGVIEARGLYFLDSRTSPESVGYRVAAQMGVPAAERQVFLDSDLRPHMIREQFLRTLEVAKKRGSAIAIGHPHPATLAMLAAEVPRAKALGYEFVAVSRLLDRPAAQAAR